MSDTAIRIENLSKQYRLGTVGTGTLSDDLKRWWYRARGKEDPFLKIGETNDRAHRGNSEYVWALRDINLEVKQGEVLGIIGKNGAGKSTLLKILSKVTGPTTGSIMAKGRIASLLEVGTGFHPELTGRENIYLNGAILGMTKAEVSKKIDEIVNFAGVERYIDTPVKRYSSGMRVRLGFAVAAFLEEEILIVDEVLAVGDAEFQKRAIGKMQEVSSSGGRTVLFVSHSMSSIRELCNNAILLKDGMIDDYGPAAEIVRNYLKNPILIKSENDFINDAKSRRGNGEARYIEIKINNGEEFIDPEKDLRINCKAKILKDIEGLFTSFMVKAQEHSEPVTSSGLICVSKDSLKKGDLISFSFLIPKNTFRTGLYPLYLWLGKPKELAENNYPYDVVDSVYYLNFVSNKPEKELGYNPVQPLGYFNFQPSIENIEITQNAIQ
ncbi:MAG: ABC transporter ATP-binding protein [Lewinellaceae bacterium]|nr:ABC transporter ATP-binding protein [Lewinellaceae bacterium]